MKVKPLKIKIKEPTPSAADRLYAKHQAIRKARGLPDPSEYKKKLDSMKSEETVQEQLYKKGRFVSGPGKKPFKAFVQAAPQNESIGDKIKIIKKGTNITKEISADSYNVFKHHGFRKEETELNEGRPSQRHPLEGHEYHKKSNEALIHIAKDAHKAAEAMKGHNTAAENKYRDQANDSATVRYFRQKNGMPDWYKKKYGHVKEETELTEAKDKREYDYEGDMAISQLRSLMFNAEDMIDMMDENTNLPEWVQSKITLAEDYISTAANYLRGELKESTEDSVEMQTTKTSRKAQIVRDAAKGKKDKQNAKDEASDKFQSEPELSSAINKT